jgi:hypothetical protein
VVSVIIPTRNRPALLRAALASLLQQSRPVDQIIVVDDASDSAEWIPAALAMSPVIEVVREERNRGVSAARNHGLDRARGDYLMFLDDDDLVAPRFVEQGLAVLAANPSADGVFFRYRTIASAEPCDGCADLPPLPEQGTCVASGRAVQQGKPGPPRHPGRAPSHGLPSLPDPDQLGIPATLCRRRSSVSRVAPAGRGHLLLDLAGRRRPPVRAR